MPQTNVKHWRRLDNAAKLFPAASSKRDTRVFRFYCELKEDIQNIWQLQRTILSILR